jgi:pimeloyl-ACP methyl ester carboxylesterase
MGDYVELEGVRTWYDDQGVGSPLVLLHGGLMTNESWFAQMPVLSSEWHVYAPERRAHGRTPDVDGPISFDDMATDTIRFLESVVGEPAALVGWSHGGIVGLLVAIARPDLVSKLVVIGTGFDTKGMVFDVDDMVSGMSHDSFEMTMMRETYSAVSPDGADHWPTVFQKITTMWTREPHIPIDDLKKLAVPVLVLVGDDDMVSLSHSVELYEALPNAALGVIPFSSHRVLMEKPDIVNPMIVDFLKNDAVPTMMPIRRRIPDS